MVEICMIAAISKNNVIGKNNSIPWKVKSDLLLFKKYTQNYPIIMGRKTLESIGRLLPNRLNIILTKNIDYSYNNAKIVNNLFDAILEAKKTGLDKIFIIGGQEIYNLFLPFVDTIYLSTINVNIEDGDSFFPDFKKDYQWKIVNNEEYNKDLLKGDEYDFTFTLYKKIY